jgi:hypothetical protein
METPMDQTTHGSTTSGPRQGLRRAAALAVAIAATLASGPAAPQRERGAAGETRAGETRDCINLRDIERTRVADADTILFYMRDGGVFRNDLSNRCPNLASDERFMYRVTQSRICDLDVITAVDDVGFGFMPRASCGLGKFRLVEDTDAELLADDRRDRRRERSSQ